MPTFLSRANIETPPTDGLDLLGETRRERIIGQCGEYHGLIDGPWKFHFCEKGGAELLFDLRDDPMEQRNRIHDAPEQAAHCRQILAESLQKRGNPAARDGLLRATSEAPDERLQRADAWPGFHSRGDYSCDFLH